MAKITAVSAVPVRPNGLGGNFVRADLWTTEEPETLPTTGAGIQGMTEKDTFAAGSSLIATGDGTDDSRVTYLVGEDGGGFALWRRH